MNKSMFTKNTKRRKGMFTAVLFIIVHTGNFSDVHNSKCPPNVMGKDIGMYSPNGKLYSIENDQYTLNTTI